ncbi:hypothetical protein [Candidatus Agathobaculum pullicola]|uniref:hypothetical protein n=1 Tax=Candidatus Agathobaculum pullicola TaxID=2838426 RepID=UPI003F90E7A6
MTGLSAGASFSPRPALRPDLEPTRVFPAQHQVAVAAMEEYAKAQDYAADFGKKRFHHEVYLSNARRCKAERLKAGIRHPVKQALYLDDLRRELLK